MDIPPGYVNTVTAGDAYNLAHDLPDASVDLVFTDPEYKNLEDYRWLANTAGRVLKPNTALITFLAVGMLPEVLPILTQYELTYKWLLGVRCAGPPLWYGDVGVKTRYALWLQKGKRFARPRITDVWFTGYHPTKRHDKPSTTGWAKNGKTNWAKSDRGTVEAMTHWLLSLTNPGDIVLDPFAGIGTIPRLCRLNDRPFVAFEIDEQTATQATEHIRSVDDDPHD